MRLFYTKVTTVSTKSAGLTNSLEHYRLIGYVSALAIQGVNGLVMYLALQREILNDPQINRFYSLKWSYMCIWNVAFHLAYAVFGILCDLPTWLDTKEPMFTKHLKSYREILFMGVVAPIGFMIFPMFWSLYFYDRALVFPKFIDKVFSQWSNHVMHTAIFPFICWEFVFLPKSSPKKHRWYLAHSYGVYIAYLCVLFETYVSRGIWAYPIMKHTYGTVYFPAIFAVVAIALYLVYRAQWYLNEVIWSSDRKSKLKSK